MTPSKRKLKIDAYFFQLRKLLEKSMKERVETYPERQKILKLIKAEEEDDSEDDEPGKPRPHRQITKTPGKV